MPRVTVCAALEAGRSMTRLEAREGGRGLLWLEWTVQGKVNLDTLLNGTQEGKFLTSVSQRN